MAMTEELIDVKELIASRSVEEHCRLAEHYFTGLDDWTYYLGKPFTDPEQTPQLLINFALLLQGLQLCPGLKVLDFGAGSCWTSHFLTQLNCKVFALDASETALKMGRELYARHPPFGHRPAPQFLRFDGERIDLPDKSVERIVCFDAFHHVPNPERILSEFSRVLVEGGIAGFSEPGPQHSNSPDSQREMRDFGVIENDVVIEQIWNEAERLGFTDLKLSVFHLPPFHLSLAAFNDLIAGGATAQDYTAATRDYIQHQRNFFLFKGERKISDSRFRRGLTAKIDVQEQRLRLRAGEEIRFPVTIINDSPAIWLPVSERVGSVELGVHVYLPDGTLLHHRFHSEPLTPDTGRAIMPNEKVELVTRIPPLCAGSYVLELDMVSNDVCWFTQNGSPTVHVQVEVN
ncbi:MAG: hypothetical protein AUG51_05525 [Acidobacteria bacterium 13_1_20CM_3_53_8]|nr:MAG: hypothetical protein AUG51_05525 [Acidobacteria bacterium 13_1_20CM_3_53_8]